MSVSLLPDLDNNLKFILDALNSVIYADSHYVEKIGSVSNLFFPPLEIIAGTAVKVKRIDKAFFGWFQPVGEKLPMGGINLVGYAQKVHH